jgi:hypothetical protein
MGIACYAELISRPRESILATILGALAEGPSSTLDGDQVGEVTGLADHRVDGDAVAYGDALSITLGEVNSPFERESMVAWNGALGQKRAALRDARKSGKLEAVREARQDLADWQREKSHHYNHQGGERDGKSLLEIARHDVDGLLRTARENLGRAIPGLEEHLKNCVRGSGWAFSYDPTGNAPVKRRKKVDRKAQVYERDSCKLAGGWYAGSSLWPTGAAGHALMKELASRKFIIDQWLSLHEKLVSAAR